jgi:hypothetical protein
VTLSRLVSLVVRTPTAVCPRPERPFGMMGGTEHCANYTLTCESLNVEIRE